MAKTQPKKPTQGKAGTKDRRVLIKFGTKKVKGKDTVLYSRVLKSVADFFGLTPVKNATRVNKKNEKVPVRGSMGAGSIQMVTEDGKTKSIPMPSGATRAMALTLANSLKSNKPVSFISRHGIRYDVGSTTK
jgi:hypothetical protein